MSKEVRDFIDLAGKELKYRLELEKTVEQLQNEIISLKKQTTEQKSLIKENDNSSKSKNLDTEDIQILKDMVMTQREELGKKKSKIEALDSKIDELKDNSVLENAHDVIDELMEEK